jgi:hypothetical protein
MIVLGPHIVHHQHQHVIAEDDSDDDQSSVDGGQQHYNYLHSDYSHEQSLSRAPMAMPDHTQYTKMLLQARLDVSKIIGSIGVPLQAFSTDCYCSNDNETMQSHNGGGDIIANINAAQHNIGDRETIRNHFNSIVELATSHTSLIQTMQSCLHMLSIGTGVRLGIGPNNIPASRRAERAWLARQLRQHDTTQQEGIKIPHRPQLTLHRCRQILHNAIIDQAKSLRSIGALGVTFDGMTDWDDFVQDLTYTMNSGCVLTLSQLSRWIDNLAMFLGDILSHNLLCRGLYQETYLRMNISNSLQMAKERIVFLQSAFSLRNEESLAKSPEKKNNGLDVNNIIDAIKSTIDGAYVSLWAFEAARLEECSKPEWKQWLGDLNDLVKRSSSMVKELEDNLLLSSEVGLSGGERIDAADESLVDIEDGELCTAPTSAVLVSDGTSKSEVPLLSNNEVERNVVPFDKTLIFSGNGCHTSSRILKTKAGNPMKSRNASKPSSFTTFHRTVLLQDLQSRLETIGLADEYEVVAATESPDDEVMEIEDRMRSQPSTSCRDPPMFLGVSGSALAELTNSIRCQQEEQEQVIIE